MQSNTPTIHYGQPLPVVARYWRNGVLETAESQVTVASVTVNHRSGWGYRVECARCGAIEECRSGSSVSYEDGPAAFAMRHRECEPADVFGISNVNSGHPLTSSSRANRARMAKTAHIYGYGSGDTGQVHGPERPEILPFIASIEVRYNGAWVPEAKGSSVWWLQRELDSIVQCYRRVRVVSPWGEELDLNGRQA
jgi:hypothetical protein